MAAARRRGWRGGFSGTPGPVTPSDGARAAADAWVRANPTFGTRTAAVWNLQADGSTVDAPTDNGQSVRFGFGRGILADFPPSIGIVTDAAPVAVPPRVVPVPVVLSPVTVTPAQAPSVVDVAPVAAAAAAPARSLADLFAPFLQAAPASVATEAASNGAAVVPASVPGEPQPVAAAPVLAEAGMFGGVSPLVLLGAAALAWYLFGRKGRR